MTTDMDKMLVNIRTTELGDSTVSGYSRHYRHVAVLIQIVLFEVEQNLRSCLSYMQMVREVPLGTKCW